MIIIKLKVIQMLQLCRRIREYFKYKSNYKLFFFILILKSLISNKK